MTDEESHWWSGLRRMTHYQLRCSGGREFDAWFRDSAAYEYQAGAGILEYPRCGKRKVVRAPNEVKRKCDYVCPKFAEEVRRTHDGESSRRCIYGKASPDDAAALAGYGVEVACLPWLRRADA